MGRTRKVTEEEKIDMAKRFARKILAEGAKEKLWPDAEALAYLLAYQQKRWGETAGLELWSDMVSPPRESYGNWARKLVGFPIDETNWPVKFETVEDAIKLLTVTWPRPMPDITSVEDLEYGFNNLVACARAEKVNTENLDALEQREKWCLRQLGEVYKKKALWLWLQAKERYD